jgi:hypothetical protein
MHDISLTILIAFYGALLSTALLGWNIYTHRTNKGKLKVLCFLTKDSITEDAKDCLMHVVVNEGRQPIMVKELGYTTKEDRFWFHPSKVGLPKMLNPYDYLVYTHSHLEIINENLRALWAVDSLDKFHKAKKSVLKNLLKKKEKPKHLVP